MMVSIAFIALVVFALYLKTGRVASEFDIINTGQPDLFSDQ